jgi:hypothetical protein
MTALERVTTIADAPGFDLQRYYRIRVAADDARAFEKTKIRAAIVLPIWLVIPSEDEH